MGLEKSAPAAMVIERLNMEEALLFSDDSNLSLYEDMMM
jgi:hypothetical protein